MGGYSSFLRSSSVSVFLSVQLLRQQEPQFIDVQDGCLKQIETKENQTL